MESVARNLEELYTEIPEGVSLVAVSKFHPSEMISEAYAVVNVNLVRAVYRNY